MAFFIVVAAILFIVVPIAILVSVVGTRDHIRRLEEALAGINRRIDALPARLARELRASALGRRRRRPPRPPGPRAGARAPARRAPPPPRPPPARPTRPRPSVPPVIVAPADIAPPPPAAEPPVAEPVGMEEPPPT